MSADFFSSGYDAYWNYLQKQDLTREKAEVTQHLLALCRQLECQMGDAEAQAIMPRAVLKWWLPQKQKERALLEEGRKYVSEHPELTPEQRKRFGVE
ncbi:MAG TPA: hypothetical protein VG055_20145 [Planctomycetaceae bacterium]|jgi:hypothetical protein|nr:hypothetical protein [Planctomycetaceae bacterium]